MSYLGYLPDALERVLNDGQELTLWSDSNSDIFVARLVPASFTGEARSLDTAIRLVLGDYFAIKHVEAVNDDLERLAYEIGIKASEGTLHDRAAFGGEAFTRWREITEEIGETQATRDVLYRILVELLRCSPENATRIVAAKSTRKEEGAT